MLFCPFRTQDLGQSFFLYRPTIAAAMELQDTKTFVTRTLSYFLVEHVDFQQSRILTDSTRATARFG